MNKITWDKAIFDTAIDLFHSCSAEMRSAPLFNGFDPANPESVGGSLRKLCEGILRGSVNYHQSLARQVAWGDHP